MVQNYWIPNLLGVFLNYCWGVGCSHKNPQENQVCDNCVQILTKPNFPIPLSYTTGYCAEI